MQGQGGLMGQQPLPDSQSGSTQGIAPSFKRIRVANGQDIDKTYALLGLYIKKPELAFTVDDFVADESVGGRQSCRLWGDNEIDPRFKRPAIPVQDDVHSTIEAYVQGLQLGDDTTLSMIKSLDWKKRQIKGEIPDSPKGFDRHNWEYASAAMVILMSLCKNVTNLYLGGVGSHTSLGHYLQKSNYGLIPQPGLQRVKRVEFIRSAHRSWDGLNYETVELLGYFRYFHRLPMLEAVFMDGVAEYQAHRELFPPGTSNLKRIRIEHADISSGMLATILRIPRKLEEVHIQEGGLWSIDGGSPHISAKTLSKALLDHKETLRVLDLDVGRSLLAMIGGAPRGMGYEEPDGLEGLEEDLGESINDYYAGERDAYFDLDEKQSDSSRPLLVYQVASTRKYGYTIGSFHDFTAMTHLSLNFRFLFGPGTIEDSPRRLVEAPPFRLIDALPPTLEYLCLYNYVRGENIDIDELVDELLNYMATRLPRLQTVRGILETVHSEGSKYSEHDSEEELWEQPELDLGWIEA
ncbi:hypothetical protein PFICI_07557 [Pestalotiopsis fici W106-1]|uniref:Uncharacterized protein n=1 Tax=Pestalotiopsis fici (strain W106-1 / CGMCC3.15140) TaxID=1229662 RepID=W3X1L4_PESFW|nr:uncharacterized protein PFICI_07557 [Pestalotiopsis fici W106-1]ETS80028.1 hypothetical protein PFICI_07557 [Pestalotiopsis fici W106-1]